MIFVQCATCGGVVGVTPYLNTAQVVENATKAIKSEIDDLRRDVGQLDYMLRTIANNMR
jgi:hypothetical protein